MNSAPTNPPRRLLRLPEVIERTGLSRTSIYRAMQAGEFPRAVPLYRRGVAWPESEVEGWIASRLTARG
ncbi:MAG: AlpA family transcriptional regulator [Myxococcota bacterium]|jgi:prophage regulatory protein|nr:AlpA family transcriptional regulator [Myxococcota bacterium]